MSNFHLPPPEGIKSVVGSGHPSNDAFLPLGGQSASQLRNDRIDCSNEGHTPQRSRRLISDLQEQHTCAQHEVQKRRLNAESPRLRKYPPISDPAGSGNTSRVTKTSRAVPTIQHPSIQHPSKQRLAPASGATISAMTPQTGQIYGSTSSTQPEIRRIPLTNVLTNILPATSELRQNPQPRNVQITKSAERENAVRSVFHNSPSSMQQECRIKENRFHSVSVLPRSMEDDAEKIALSRQIKLLREDIGHLTRTVVKRTEDLLKQRTEHHGEVLRSMEKTNDILERALKVEFRNETVSKVLKMSRNE